MTRDTLILFPGALGDFLCLWPSLCALREPLIVYAQPQLLELLATQGVSGGSVDRREIADLFATTPLAARTVEVLGGFRRVHSWTGYGNVTFAQRLQSITAGTVHVHQFRGMRAGEHAAQYFARCLGVEPETRLLHLPPEAEAWAAELWSRHELADRALVIHAGSGSPRKNWEGMAAVAAMWRAGGGRVLSLCGPAEAEHPSHIPSDAAAVDEPLPRVAALLRRAHRYLGNDSGISHLAGAVGARGAVVFGASDPQVWHPLGDTLRVVIAGPPCASCGTDRLCIHRLDPARVLAALDD